MKTPRRKNLPPIVLPLPKPEMVDVQSEIEKELAGDELENIRALKRIRGEGGVAGSNAIKLLREIAREKKPQQSRQVRLSFDVGAG